MMALSAWFPLKERQSGLNKYKMEQNNIQEINENYLGVLVKIELLNEQTNDYVLGQMVGYVERDILEVAAMYDMFADNNKDKFARSKQVLLDEVRRKANGKNAAEKKRIFSKLRKQEDEFVKSMP